MKQEQILTELNSFIGTEQYHKASNLYDLNLTDGVQYLRDSCNCYWLLDIIGSVQYLKEIKENKAFIIWRIEVNEDKSFIVSAYRDSPFNKENLLYKQKAEYTDFPLKEFEFYQCNKVILLKSEY